MITIVELKFIGWEHEECNSGIIRLLSSVTSEKICLAAHAMHIDVLKSVGIPENIDFFELDFKALSEMQKEEAELDRNKLIESIIAGLHLSISDKIFFLSSPEVVMSAAVYVNTKYNIPLYFIVHADLDELLKGAFRYSNDCGYETAIKRAGEYSFSHFITFSPYAKSKLGNIIPDNILSKFIFLNHPVHKKAVVRKKRDIISIGAYGACVNKNLTSLLKRLQGTNFEEKVNFEVHRRASSINQLDYKYKFPVRGVKVHSTLKGFSRDEKLNFISCMDWILLPYDESMYQVSMSGILADAIGYEVPVLALNSSIIDWYNKEPIGIVAGNVAELSKIICSEEFVYCEKEHLRYRENMKKLKKQIEAENIKIVQGILKEEL